MKNKSLAAIGVSFLLWGALASAGTRFGAPAINGIGNVTNPDVGDILFDTNTGHYWGYTVSGWVDFSTPSAPVLSVVSKTATYNAAVSDNVILADTSAGSWALTLYSAVGNSGVNIRIKKTSSDLNALTIATISSQTIDGLAASSLNTQNETIDIVSDGSRWQILDRMVPMTWVAFNPTITGFGTPSNVSMFYRRVGPNLEVQGTFTSGATAATMASFELPLGLALDPTKISLSNNTNNPGAKVGWFVGNGGPNAALAIVTAPLTSTNMVYLGGYITSGSSALLPSNGSQIYSSAVQSIEFSVPISGWN
jgi:hypothetical protein